MNLGMKELVAQLNASAVPQAAKQQQQDADKKKKPAAKSRASKSTSSGGAPGAVGAGSAKNARKDTTATLKLRGTGNTVTQRAATGGTTANALAAASATAAAPLDPTTAPLLKRVKDVLDCLLKHNGTRFSPAQLKDETGHNLETDMALLREVHRHPRMTYQGAPAVPSSTAAPPTAAAAWYSYLPEIPGIHDKIALLNYIRDNKGPALLTDVLAQCYLQAADDLKQLKAEGKVFIVGHPDSGKETVFVRDMLGMEGVQEDVRMLWFEVTQEHVKDHVPQGLLELQNAVTKAGLRSALANQPIKRALPGAPRERAKKPRQQRINLNKATNAHLPFLFSGAQPTNIDS